MVSPLQRHPHRADPTAAGQSPQNQVPSHEGRAWRHPTAAPWGAPVPLETSESQLEPQRHRAWQGLALGTGGPRSRGAAPVPNFSLVPPGFIVTHRVTGLGAPRNPRGGGGPRRSHPQQGGTLGQANPLRQGQGWAPRPPRTPAMCHRPRPHGSHTIFTALQGIWPGPQLCLESL